jgi:hypothetical protein
MPPKSAAGTNVLSASVLCNGFLLQCSKAHLFLVSRTRLRKSTQLLCRLSHIPGGTCHPVTQ